MWQGTKKFGTVVFFLDRVGLRWAGSVGMSMPIEPRPRHVDPRENKTHLRICRANDGDLVGFEFVLLLLVGGRPLPNSAKDD